MATVQLVVKQPNGGAWHGEMVSERVPVAGDYVAPARNQLVRVVAVVLEPVSSRFAATALAINDPDDRVDEWTAHTLAALREAGPEDAPAP